MAGNKQIAISFLCLSLYLNLIGCAVKPVAFDLVEYVNQDLLGIAQLEDQSRQYYAAVTGKNYTTDEAVRAALKNQVIPLYDRFLDLLKQIRPQTEAVRQLHVKFIRGIEMQSHGLKLQLQGLEKKDNALIRSGAAEIEKSKAASEKWRQELFALYRAHGVVSKETKK